MQVRPKRPFIFFFTHWLPLIFWMGVIFWLSHQDKEETTLQTGWIKELLALLNIDGAKLMTGSYGFMLRKLAHVTVYALLANFAFRVASAYFGDKRKWLYPVIFCLIYAITDEFHQTFIPGRYGSPVDVGIDMIGVGIVLLGWWIFMKKEKGRP